MGAVPVRPDVRPSEPMVRVLLALGDDVLHGYGIMQVARERSGGAIALLPGTLYSTIKRMLTDGLVEECDPPRGSESTDARRRYYRVTKAGRILAAAETRRMAALVRLGRVFLD
jgi:DNA-binding PadR family transcriptional regulator